jgi:hypothetical protein
MEHPLKKILEMERLGVYDDSVDDVRFAYITIRVGSIGSADSAADAYSLLKEALQEQGFSTSEGRCDENVPTGRISDSFSVTPESTELIRLVVAVRDWFSRHQDEDVQVFASAYEIQRDVWNRQVGMKLAVPEIAILRDMDVHQIGKVSRALKLNRA